jgi:hypothetical protein
MGMIRALLWHVLVCFVCLLCASASPCSAEDERRCVRSRFDQSLPPLESRAEALRSKFRVPFYLYTNLGFRDWCSGDFERMLKSSKHCASEFFAHR